MAKANKSRQLMERLDRALELLEDFDKGMYDGWRPSKGASARKRDDGFDVQTPFDQDYEVADKQNREDARHAEELDDRYEGEGDFNGDHVVDAWEDLQDGEESPHTMRRKSRKARDEEDEDEEDEKSRRKSRKARDEDDEEDEDEEEEKSRRKSRKARDEEDEDEEEEKSRRKARKSSDMDEEEEDAEEEAEHEEKSRKARHRDKCRCMKCLVRKADAFEKSREAERKARKSRKARDEEDEGEEEETRKSFTMSDLYEASMKSVQGNELVYKAIGAFRDELVDLGDQLIELRDDLNGFMSAPQRKSKLSNTNKSVRREDGAPRDLRAEAEILIKSIESMDPMSPNAQALMQDVASLELGYPDKLSAQAKAILRESR
jgi:hypothetical protein